MSISPDVGVDTPEDKAAGTAAVRNSPRQPAPVPPASRWPCLLPATAAQASRWPCPLPFRSPWERPSPQWPPNACPSEEGRSQERVHSPQSHQGHKDHRKSRQEDGAEGFLPVTLFVTQAVTRRLLLRSCPSCLLCVLGDFVVKSPGRRPPCGRGGLSPACPNAHPPAPTETTPAAARLRTGLARRCFRFLAFLSLSPTEPPDCT